VSLAIDDFGTGYSFRSNLKDIPARKLKLDYAYVTVLPKDAKDRKILMLYLMTMSMPFREFSTQNPCRKTSFFHG
jgi:EAL domain-containing protein (putative c-di-GMP-specific phosphodiesterase class I)